MKRVFLFTTMTAGLISLCSSAVAKPLKVYILAGQSNMEGHAAVSTFDHIGMDPKTAPMLKEMRNADGTPRVCDNVWISYLTGGKDGNTVKQGQLTVDFGSLGKEPKIGPEFTFGIYLQKQLNEPILLIKTAWGGKSLYGDFLPPSGAKKSGKEAGEYYRLMIAHVKTVLGDIKKVYPGYNPEQKYEIAGFFWFQGWNDMVNGTIYPNRDKPGGYDLYSELLADLIRDMRKDLDAPKMNVVIGVMGIGGPTALYSSPRYKGVHQNFRDAMAAPASMPEFKGNVTAVLTEKYWDSELESIAERMGRKEALTPRELEILKKGKSNQGYHYLGSSKILGQIGKACAEAMADFEKQKK
jgi:alpha-galactosidase